MALDYPITMDDKMELSTIASKDAVDEPVQQPSLQELALKKAMSEITNPSFNDSDFESFEPRLQRLLFSKLRSEVVRLQKIEKCYAYLEQWIPYADRLLYVPAARRRIPYPDNYSDDENHEPNEDDDESVQENGYTLQERYRDTWSYSSDDGIREQSWTDDSVYWSCTELSFEPPTLNLELKDRKTLWDLRSGTNSPGYFSERISSQLLQYRLTVMFGMMSPIETDEYKCCWGAYLLHKDGRSVLVLDEHKGAASGHFSGSPEASVDALGLLNFLCGNNIPHSYDGILAGTVA